MPYVTIKMDVHVHLHMTSGEVARPRAPAGEAGATPAGPQARSAAAPHGRPPVAEVAKRLRPFHDQRGTPQRRALDLLLKGGSFVFSSPPTKRDNPMRNALGVIARSLKPLFPEGVVPEGLLTRASRTRLGERQYEPTPYARAVLAELERDARRKRVVEANPTMSFVSAPLLHPLQLRRSTG